ncbi:unnamed protein product [Symbiodinium sp. CCMP2592]|nr:unnamed protein product [Symbiodinium sp. CCMP2592]
MGACQYSAFDYAAPAHLVEEDVRRNRADQTVENIKADKSYPYPSLLARSDVGEEASNAPEPEDSKEKSVPKCVAPIHCTGEDGRQGKPTPFLPIPKRSRPLQQSADRLMKASTKASTGAGPGACMRAPRPQMAT